MTVGWCRLALYVVGRNTECDDARLQSTWATVCL